MQAKTQAVRMIQRQREDGSAEVIALGYEYTQQVSLMQEESTVQWDERVLVIRSLKLAQTQQAALRERLSKAQAELALLNQSEHKRGKKVWRQVAEVREGAEAIVHRYRVDGLEEPVRPDGLESRFSHRHRRPRYLA